MGRKRDRWDSSSEDDDNERPSPSSHQPHKPNHSTPLPNDSNNRHSNDTSQLAQPQPITHAIASTIGGNEQQGVVVEKESRGSSGTGGLNSRNGHPDGNEGEVGSSQGKVLPKHNPLLSGCRSVYDCYERLARLDEGTYGVVWKARDMATNEIVALKQIKFDPALMKEGFPMAALREIGVLLALDHECIVTVREMVVGDSFDKVFMAMEYMEMDLQEATKKSSTTPFQQSELKSMLHQILSATHHIHSKWILHRDIKTSNILVSSKSGKLALCDFGLARKYQVPGKAMTQMVVTLWYRCPELLFGERVYGPEIDVWSVGCVFGELLKKKAILQGRGELDQITRIIRLLGPPTPESWPDFTLLPNSRTFRWTKKGQPEITKEFPVNSFSGGQTFLDENGFDLLRRMLEMDPKKRITAKEALEHRYFREGVEKRRPDFMFF